MLEKSRKLSLACVPPCFQLWLYFCSSYYVVTNFRVTCVCREKKKYTRRNTCSILRVLTLTTLRMKRGARAGFGGPGTTVHAVNNVSLDAKTFNFFIHGRCSLPDWEEACCRTVSLTLMTYSDWHSCIPECRTWEADRLAHISLPYGLPSRPTNQLCCMLFCRRRTPIRHPVCCTREGHSLWD